MLPWSLLLSFIPTVVVGVLMGALVAGLQGAHAKRLEISRARVPDARIGRKTLWQERAGRS